MDRKSLDENCIQQMYRLLANKLYETDKPSSTDNLIRIDDYEMRDDVQEEISKLWGKMYEGDITIIPDIEEYRKEFFKLFGFGWQDVDYDQDVNEDVLIPSIKL